MLFFEFLNIFNSGVATPFGIFGGGTMTGGGHTAVSDKYIYSDDSVVGGTVLGTVRESLSATGNSTRGIFGGGFTTDVTAVTDKYTYSDDSVVGGTSLGIARSYSAATGNSTRGIFGGGDDGSSSAVTDKYTYSDDSVV